MSCATKPVHLLGSAQAMCGARNREHLNENTRERRQQANWSLRASPASVDRARASLGRVSRFDWNCFRKAALKL
jgi:hypothetical protein